MSVSRDASQRWERRLAEVGRKLLRLSVHPFVHVHVSQSCKSLAGDRKRYQLLVNTKHSTPSLYTVHRANICRFTLNLEPRCSTNRSTLNFQNGLLLLHRIQELEKLLFTNHTHLG
ncbi:uncharacterized protein LOC120352736 [Nilaparvata lugens]|uniref:uncharacterized protein LOC120352736 n=1 Tax=Nilaparvata lugens TaxID=108931 RepID=UPI00193D47B8|nr:uncharacterized protein LOC120352736 [Nilaparvata lugens]